jgi:hypothetical protein
MVPLNLPVHIVSQIQQWFGRKPAESVQAYHYKSDRLNDVLDVEWSRFYVLLKYAKQSKYLVHDSIKGDSDNFFILQGGTTQHLQNESTTASHFARRCYDIFTVFKRKESLPLESVIILPTPVQLFVQQTFKAPTVQSAVTSYCYAKREQNFVRLPASWNEDGTEFASIYPSLRDWKTGFQGDFSKTMSVWQFNSSILGESMKFLSPGQVKASQAWQCLKLQTSNDWKIEIPEIDAKKIELSSMGLDFDYGLIYLQACCGLVHLQMDIMIAAIERIIPKEASMSPTPYIPRGTNFRFADSDLPTINQKDSGVYILVPAPVHTIEVCKMWFFVETEFKPDNFLEHIRLCFRTAAQRIVHLDNYSTTETKKIALSVINSESSTQSTQIRGGILLSIAAYCLLSKTVKNVRLVMETYNGKHKGMSVNVSFEKSIPNLTAAAASLAQLVSNGNSIISTVSSMVKDGLAIVDNTRSQLGFGFRTLHRIRDTGNIAYCNFKSKEAYKEILYPMAFIPPRICPNLTFYKTSPIQRVQTYLEYFSMQKSSNHNQKFSYPHKVGSNLKKAASSDGNVNLSALKRAIEEILTRFDQSFSNFQQIGGSRIEIATKPVLSKVESSLAFDFEACVQQCWTFINKDLHFYNNDDLAQYGSLNTAASVLGYRFALDALSDPEDATDVFVKSQQHAFCFMRYSNSVINTICNGQFVDCNPKLFMAKLGSIAGRPLNLIPDIPINISKKICIYLKEDMPDIESPKSAALKVDQNLIQNRIQQNITETELKDVITTCCGCGKCFYGNNPNNISITSALI